MATKTRPRGARPTSPLTFKQAGRETCFAAGAVQSVKLLKSERAPGLDLWFLEVNGETVWKGTERSTRRQHTRALRYI